MMLTMRYSNSQPITVAETSSVYVIFYDTPNIKLHHGEHVQVNVRVQPPDQPIDFRLKTPLNTVIVATDPPLGAIRTITIVDLTTPLDDWYGPTDIAVEAYLPDGTPAVTDQEVPIDLKVAVSEFAVDHWRRVEKKASDLLSIRVLNEIPGPVADAMVKAYANGAAAQEITIDPATQALFLNFAGNQFNDRLQNAIPELRQDIASSMEDPARIAQLGTLDGPRQLAQVNTALIAAPFFVIDFSQFLGKSGALNQHMANPQTWIWQRITKNQDLLGFEYMSSRKWGLNPDQLMPRPISRIGGES